MKRWQIALKRVALLGLVLCLVVSNTMPMTLAAETEPTEVSLINEPSIEEETPEKEETLIEKEIVLFGEGTACSGHRLIQFEPTGQTICANAKGEAHVWCDYNFPGSKFRQKVNDTYGNYLTEASLAKIDSFTADKCGNVAGVELLTGLINLTIKDCTIDTLDLRGMKGLKSLIVESDSYVISTVNLTDLDQLASLKLDGIGLKSLIFDRLPELTFAEIYYSHSDSGDQVLDLSGCTNLYHLTLNTSYRVKLGDLSELSELSLKAGGIVGGELNLSGSENLSSVYLDCDMARLDLSGCTYLKEVTCKVSGCSINAIDVSDCPRLKRLEAAYIELQDLDIRNASKLEYLSASAAAFSYAGTTPIGGYNGQFLYGNNPNLKELCLTGNSISRLDLTSFPGLVNLELMRMPLLAGVDLSACTKLQEVWILPGTEKVADKLTSLDFSKCLDLRKIFISNNTGLKNLNLDNLHRLEVLHMDNTGVEVLDLSDCWSIDSVLCTGRNYSVKKGTLINPTGMPGEGVTFQGWIADEWSGEISPDLGNYTNSQEARWTGRICLTFHTSEDPTLDRPFERYTSFYYNIRSLTSKDFYCWSLNKTGTGTRYFPGEIMIPTKDMELWPVFARYCSIWYQCGGTTGTSGGYLLPYGQDTYEFELGYTAKGEPVSYANIPGRVLTGWKVYDMDGPDPDTPIMCEVGGTVELHGDATIVGVYETIVSHAQVNIVPARVDGTPQAATTKTQGITLTTTWKRFFNGQPILTMNSDSVFASGQKYRCFVTLTPKDGFVLGEDFELTTPGCAVEYSSSSANEKNFYVDFEPQAPFLHLLNFLVPVAGMDSDTFQSYDLYATYPVIKSGFQWLDSDKKPFSGTFEAGKTYYASIEIATRIGEFPTNSADLELIVKKNNGTTKLIVSETKTAGKVCTFLVKCIVPSGLVEMTVSMPVAFSTGSNNVTYTVDKANVSYRVVSSAWKDPIDDSTVYGTLFPGELYRAYFTFEVPNTSVGFLINGQIPVVNFPTQRQANVYLDLEAKMNYIVSLDPNGGTGAMDGAVLQEGKTYTLPPCTFTAPEGQTFDCWTIDGEDYLPFASVIITEDTTVSAKWKDLPPVKINATYDSGTVSVTIENLSPRVSGLVLVTQYSSVGRQKAVKTVQLERGISSCALDDFTRESGDTFRVFLVNVETYAPMAAPGEC